MDSKKSNGGDWNDTPEEREEFVKSVESKSLIGAHFTELADVKSEAIQWLWPGRFALGKVSMISGDPGTGKSILTLAMASIVSNGSDWPVDKTPCPQGDVILISCEDGIADTIKPRLEAIGADCSRIRMLDWIDYTEAEEHKIRMPDLTRDIDELRKALTDRPQTKAIIIDPATAFCGDTDSNNNSEVRALLAPLAALAAEFNVAIILVNHLNKNTSGNAITRSIGSIGWVGAVRSAYMVTKCETDPTRRFLTVAKNNIGADTEGLSFTINTNENDIAFVMFDAEPVKISANEALGIRTKRGPRPIAREKAMRFISEALFVNGSMLSDEIISQGAIDGHSLATMKAAKKELGVESYRIENTGQWRWRLGGNDLPI